MRIKSKNCKNLLYKDLSYDIVGCFFEVYNELGPGFKESVYRKALTIEFALKNITHEEERRIPIKYKNKTAGYYTPDFIIDKKIIIEIKAVEIMPKFYETQLYNYLKGTNYKLGYIINFGATKIDIRRRILDKKRIISSSRNAYSSV
ncbi:MAG: GxxExxY protein [Candidatus Omnitrophica bacterium]|nr:GxxExxY protein [Candidatus Omnitrophota bacterium]